jgi:RNA polymerase sigma-70 factor, ECF subfamily
MNAPTRKAATPVDRDAFSRWYCRHADAVFRVVSCRVGDPHLAEDLTAETFVRALAATQSATVEIHDPGAWLTTIARNLVRDHYRCSRHRREITTGDLDDLGDRGVSALGPEQAVIIRETHEELRDALQQLPPAHQECLRLRFWQDLPLAATATAMGCPVGTVKARQHHAIRRLARLLPDDSELAPPQPETTDPLTRAQQTVTEVSQRVAEQQQQRIAEQQQGRAHQLTPWHAADQAEADEVAHHGLGRAAMAHTEGVA